MTSQVFSSSASQRAEELAETATVWAGSEAREIEMNEDKIETIKNLMSGVVLGNVPVWARELDTSDTVWRSKMGGTTNKSNK